MGINILINTIRRIFKKKFFIIGLVMMRDEELLIQDTLDSFSKIVDGIIVIDDVSTDRSADIAENHPAVLEVIRKKIWNSNRQEQQTKDRQMLLEAAQKYDPQWLFYSDCDERFEGDIREFLHSSEVSEVGGIRIKLFDSYITADDRAPYKKGELYNFRKWFGPERRDILMVWKNSSGAYFKGRGVREPGGIKDKIITKFYCQHYGKSLSINHWESTCDYYIKFPEPFHSKWMARKGKAIHDKSDFSNKLYTWKDAKNNAILSS